VSELPASSPVVGLTFVKAYPGNLRTLQRRMDLAHLKCVTGSLVRNPDNPHDHNAVEVHATDMGMIGHLPADLAIDVAPLLDTEAMLRDVEIEVRISPDHPDRPGATVFFLGEA
jgi:hypothetical protein